jgi:hypothetical protein
MFRTHITNLGNMVGTQWELDGHTLEQQKFNIPTLPQKKKKPRTPRWMLLLLLIGCKKVFWLPVFLAIFCLG